MSFVLPAMAAIGGGSALTGGLIAAGAGLGAVSAVSAAGAARAGYDSQAGAAEWNARTAQVQAQQARYAAGQQEEMQRRKARETVGTALAAGGEAGIALEGSFADLFRQSLYDAEADAMAIRYRGELEAAGLNNQAAMERVNAANARSMGRQATRAGYLSAAGSLLNSGANYMKAGGNR